MSFAYNDALDDNTTAATEPSSDTGTAVLERPRHRSGGRTTATPTGSRITCRVTALPSRA